MPKYRVTNPDGCMPMSGLQYSQGAEIEWRGWPTRDLQPVEGDQDAERIFSFWKRHRNDGELTGRYTSPYSPLVGRNYLPTVAIMTTGDSKPNETYPSPRIPSVPKPAEMVSGMPMWRLLRRAWYGGEILDPGATVTYVGWPTMAGVLAPVTDAAESIAVYYSENAIHPAFESVRSPWDEFTRAVVLPALPRSTRLPPPIQHPAYGRPSANQIEVHDAA